MGKVGRVVCIFTPMALSLASLALLIVVGLGGTNSRNDGLNNLFFFRANTSDMRVDVNKLDLPDGFPIEKYFNISDTDSSSTVTNVADFYHVGLWNYCSGDLKPDQSYDIYNADKSDEVTNCTKRAASFWFNPVEVWGLNQTVAEQLFSKQLRDGLNAYKVVTKWMFIAYLVAVISTAVEIIVGCFAIFSRWGSLATTIVSSISSIFTIAFALTATILYATLSATFNTALRDYNISSSIGATMFIVVWLAVAFSWAGGLFWLLSTCCCSGRSDRIKGYHDRDAKHGGRGRNAPYEYERVSSPFLGNSGNGKPAPSYQSGTSPQLGVPMQSMGQKGTAYEPYRHGQT